MKLEGKVWRVGTKYRESTIRNHHRYVREFLDMDAGCHFKWVSFSISGKKYDIGSFDIVRKEDIDWNHTKEVSA